VNPDASADAAGHSTHRSPDRGKAGDRGKSSRAMPSAREKAWHLYTGTGLPLSPADRDARWPVPPPWRTFTGGGDVLPPLDAAEDGETARILGRIANHAVVNETEVDQINAAIYLRRPLLVTGPPGSGKSSLAHQITRELGLGRVLRWPITSRTALKSGEYEYDAIGRARAVSAYRSAPPERSDVDQVDGQPELDDELIGRFIQLGPLGTALLPRRLPRVLLIDELDKGDIDLPNDLLNVFEEGQFAIPELLRVRNTIPRAEVFTADPGGTAEVQGGVIRCQEFPIVVITSNGERDFPPAFLRRCLTMNLGVPSREKLAAMVAAHFPNASDDVSDVLVGKFLGRVQSDGLAADQLLNAVHLATSGVIRLDEPDEVDALLETVWHRLTLASG
jgi:MoxR-like ATPase